MKSNGSVRLMWTWNPASDHGHPVTFYEVEAKTEFFPQWRILLTDIPEANTVVETRPMRHYVDVYDLLPYNSYSFRVRAKNNMGVGPPSKQSEIYRVPSAAPVVAPQGVGGGGGKVGLLCMTWQPLERQEEGGEGFGYILYWKLASDEKGKPAQKDVGNVTRHCETVGEDNYYILYVLHVQAYNHLGKGPMSSTGYAYSAEGMPSARPTNVNYISINGTALTVYWNPVPNTREAVKGRVLGYRIDYTDNDDPINGQTNARYVYCDCGEGIVVGLDPDRHYWLRVSVLNSAGLGVPSEQYLAATEQAPASNYPQIVDVLPDGEHSARVQWRGIDMKILEGALKGYKLLYWPVGEDIRTANFTLTDRRTSAVIHGLHQDVIYKLRILAVNKGGEGKKSPTVYFTVLKGGAINVHLDAFDPSTSQMLIASAATRSFSILFALAASVCHVIVF